jgi:hypothetical protein
MVACVSFIIEIQCSSIEDMVACISFIIEVDQAKTSCCFNQYHHEYITPYNFLNEEKHK